MKLLLLKRHYTYLRSLNLKPTDTKIPRSKESQILHLCKSGALLDAFQHLNSLDTPHISLKSILYASLLQTSTKALSLTHDLQLHAHVIKSGLKMDCFMGNSLLALYFKLGPDFKETVRVFDGLFVKGVISWTSMISRYINAGKPRSSLDMFLEMLGFGVEPNGFTLSTVIKACLEIGDLKLGRCFHGVVMRRGFDSNQVISKSTLVDLYAKCGCIDFARIIFRHMMVRNLITWNSMICGFAQNGRPEEALGVFNEMMREGIELDSISFIGVLFACSHTGLVIERRKHFSLMTEEYGIKARAEHYNYMVDLLGRAGFLEEAKSLIENADCRSDSSIWVVLLGACITYTNPATAKRIAKKMMKLKPEYHLTYVLLANVYKAVGRWKDAQYIRS
ncbi:PPR domain-containing protein/PPR_2 domain-containing protein [Cephalotus follicularis]|uniref:PPR domain-containing protein/PPR_2 domain-containing protein n=1 Tax=Cephalotus follicularis TaxID=3775 RepID=A0A1Q3D9S4_CEPFO|nr:PPR domain-containing protein/PPR_2 domain-containing protein [Cephalotus follicularis]